MTAIASTGKRAPGRSPRRHRAAGLHVHVVILADRGDHIMMWTAYSVDAAYRRKQMRAEWERSGGEDPLKG